MEFITNPFLLSEDVTLSVGEPAGVCGINLGCCCLALTGS